MPKERSGNMKNSCKFISKLIFATIVLLVGSLFALPADESLAATTTITYNAKDKKYYYPDGSYRSGLEDDPLFIDVEIDKIIIDYTGADSFAYPFYFRIVNMNDYKIGGNKVYYAKYMIDEKTQDKKFVMERIGAKGKNSEWYVVTPDNETTGKTYLQPGAIYHDKSEDMGYTAPLFSFTSSVLLFQEAANLFSDGLVAVFDSDKYWLFEQRLGNAFITADTMAANAASYPAAYVFAITGIKDDNGNTGAKDVFTGKPLDGEDDGTNIDTEDLFKFSSIQISDSVGVTIKEKKGMNIWDWNPIVGITNLILGKFSFSPAVYNVKNEHKLSNSRLAIDFDDPDHPIEIRSFVYLCNGPSSDGLDGSDANAVEKVVSKLLISIGSVFRGAVSAMDGGKDLSIDALIFNEYKPTKIDFFEPEDGVYTTTFRNVIESWFKAFKYLAILVLIILIPAIAIKVVLYAGTPNQKKVPGMISGWVVAVALMMFGPYLMKYMVKLNNVIVKIFRDNSDYSIYSVYNADYIASHQWAQDFQVGEDSETSFADWLQQNIQQQQKEWQDIAQELGTISGDFVLNAQAIGGIIEDIALWLNDIATNVQEGIESSISFDLDVTSGFLGDHVEDYEHNINSIKAMIDTGGRNKVYTEPVTVNVTNVKIGDIPLSDLSNTVSGWINSATAALVSFSDELANLETEISNTIASITAEFENMLAAAVDGIISAANTVIGWFTGDSETFTTDELEARHQERLAEIEADRQARAADIEARRQARENVINSVGNSIANLLSVEYQIEQLIQNRVQLWIDYYQKMEDLAEMEDALALFTKNIDLENAMKTRAAKTYRLVIVAIWYILMYQLVLLMFLYYKRLIMIAVLIILFPLVIMFYAFERFMGIDKPASFKVWVQEFLINVFIQSVHALLYVSLVETGLRIYEADADNWLFLLFATTAIFPMEGIIKSMLGLKGSTVGSLASSAAKGAAAVGAATAIAKTATQGAKGVDAKYDEKNKKNQEKAEKQDKKTEAKRAKRDNKIKRNELRGGNTEDSKKRLDELHAKDAKKDEARKKKREKIKKRNERMKKYARRGQIARNIVGAATAVSVSLAAGGDPSDFQVGAAVGNVVAGKVKKNTKKGDDKSSKDTKKAPAGQTQNNQNQQGGQNTQKPTGGAPQGQTQAAANANAATQAADQGRPMTASEAAEAKNKSNMQQAFREQIALRQATQGTVGNTGVSSHTSISHTEE